MIVNKPKGLTGFSQIYSQYKKTLHSEAIDSRIHIFPKHIILILLKTLLNTFSFIIDE